jgi:hypothetical protein
VTASRDLSTVLFRRGRLSLVLEPRDLWIGVYVAPGAVWVCLVPCLPLRWERRGQRRTTPGNAEPAAEWLPGRWR